MGCKVTEGIRYLRLAALFGKDGVNLPQNGIEEQTGMIFQDVVFKAMQRDMAHPSAG